MADDFDACIGRECGCTPGATADACPDVDMVREWGRCWCEDCHDDAGAVIGDADTGALGESGDVDGLGLDAFAGPSPTDDGSIYLDTDPAPTPWGWGLGPIAPTSIRIDWQR